MGGSAFPVLSLIFGGAAPFPSFIPLNASLLRLFPPPPLGLSSGSFPKCLQHLLPHWRPGVLYMTPLTTDQFQIGRGFAVFPQDGHHQV